MQDYGKRIKQARINKNYTQVEIATKLGIPQQNYQRIESGKYDLKMSTIYNICKALEISADWLLGLSKD